MRKGIPSITAEHSHQDQTKEVAQGCRAATDRSDHPREFPRGSREAGEVLRVAGHFLNRRLFLKTFFSGNGGRTSPWCLGKAVLENWKEKLQMETKKGGPSGLETN